MQEKFICVFWMENCPKVEDKNLFSPGNGVLQKGF
jgi:hypothetical protein